jgi:hypothetical protein
MADDDLHQQFQSLTESGMIPHWRLGFVMDGFPPHITADQVERRRKLSPVSRWESDSRRVQIIELGDGDYLAEFWHGAEGMRCIEVFVESEAALLDLMSSGRIPAFLALP